MNDFDALQTPDGGVGLDDVERLVLYVIGNAEGVEDCMGLANTPGVHVSKEWLQPQIKREVNELLGALSTTELQHLAAVADLGRGVGEIGSLSELTSRANEWYPLRGMALDRVKVDKSRLAAELRRGWKLCFNNT